MGSVLSTSQQPLQSPTVSNIGEVAVENAITKADAQVTSATVDADARCEDTDDGYYGDSCSDDYAEDSYYGDNYGNLDVDTETPVLQLPRQTCRWSLIRKRQCCRCPRQTCRWIRGHLCFKRPRQFHRWSRPSGRHVHSNSLRVMNTKTLVLQTLASDLLIVMDLKSPVLQRPALRSPR